MKVWAIEKFLITSTREVSKLVEETSGRTNTVFSVLKRYREREHRIKNMKTQEHDFEIGTFKLEMKRMIGFSSLCHYLLLTVCTVFARGF